MFRKLDEVPWILRSNLSRVLIRMGFPRPKELIKGIEVTRADSCALRHLWTALG